MIHLVSMLQLFETYCTLAGCAKEGSWHDAAKESPEGESESAASSDNNVEIPIPCIPQCAICVVWCRSNQNLLKSSLESHSQLPLTLHAHAY